MKNIATKILGCEQGAVAPIVALSLFALLGVGGIAFDYARLATMDTELQQAADLAALAAAGQLDRVEAASGGVGAQARARSAITDGTAANRLAANITRMANDGGGRGVQFNVANIIFCSAFDDSKAAIADACDETNVDADSRFVVVTTTARTANYALTPVVAAFSGTVSATAVAGVESSICNVAPLLVCVADDFPASDDVGKGMVLKPLDGVNGNYGLLDFGNGNNAVIDALMGHGLSGCQATDDNQTEPGTKSITDAVNTRLDVYGGGPKTKSPAACVTADGTGCPALGTGKDMIRSETYVVDTDPSVTATPAAPVCGEAGTAFPGELTLGTQFALSAPAKGLQRDNCHYTGTCTEENGNVGDKAWDRDAYFLANYGWDSAQWKTGTGLGAGVTRYEVYSWELTHNASHGSLGPVTVLAPAPTTELKKVQGEDRKIWTFNKQCAYRSPIFGSTNYPEQKDRRILPVVAANCENLNGKGAAYEDYTLLRVFDVFLTEPSMQRPSPRPTDDKEIYGEVMGPAQTFEGGSGFQYYSRNRPYLVR